MAARVPIRLRQKKVGEIAVFETGMLKNNDRRMINHNRGSGLSTLLNLKGPWINRILSLGRDDVQSSFQNYEL
jgi:hypothetical protein